MDAAIGLTGPDGSTIGRRAGAGSLAMVLAATFLVRAVGLDQPIVENYVGRQVPTAMVARNLERGSGLLRPRLDTAPLPNYFLVEPPLYEFGVVALRRATGLGLEAAGRLLSAMATAAAGWGTLRADAAASRPARGDPGRRRLRRLPADDPVRPRLPARRRHARRRRGGPGLLGSFSWDVATRRAPGLVRRRLDAPGAGPGDQDHRRAPADPDGLRRAPAGGGCPDPVAAVRDALAGALVVRVGRPPGRGGGRLAGVGR